MRPCGSKGETVGLATVYRHLQALTEAGSIDTIRDASGETSTGSAARACTITT